MVKESKIQTNRYIVSIIDELVSLMEVHEEEPRRIKSYQNAIFNIERYKKPLIEQTDEEILTINGVGKSTLSLIKEVLETGTCQELERLQEITPAGIIDLMGISGIGPGKIKVLWHQHNIESIEAFKALIDSGQISEVKGFGEKTIKNIVENIQFYLESKGKLLLSQANDICMVIEESFSKENGIKLFRTGDIRRAAEVILAVEFIVETNDKSKFADLLGSIPQIEIVESNSGPFVLRAIFNKESTIIFHFAEESSVEVLQMRLTGSTNHFSWMLSNGVNPYKGSMDNDFSEDDFYIRKLGKNIIPELREGMLEDSIEDSESLIKDTQLKGILHNHSTYSDGANTLREMAEAVKNMGYEYFGIADHSRSAFFYANGLYEERVLKQHEEIDALNKELAPFRIFKGIESDILTDGDLDYEPDILKSFDYIVASIHGGLNMDEQKATERLVRAIRNPYTTIMGHLTGRLLLARKGYPVNHKIIIDECAANNVGIEINAHPIRLDLDWRWVNYAIEKNVMISINPDAHSVDGLDMHYGTLIGRKGGLTAKHTLNAMSVEELGSYFDKRKSKIS